MARPKANVFLSNGNLGGQPLSQFGTAGVIVSCAIAPVAGYLTPFIVKSKKDIDAAFVQVGNEAPKAALEAFYDEAPEGTSLYVIAVVQTNQFVQMAGATIAPVLINNGNGAIRLLAVIKFPAGSYVPTITNGFDQDVHDGVPLFQTLADTWFANRKPFRVLMQGYGATTAGAAKDYATDNKHNIGIVVADIGGSTAFATMLALGRLSKEQPQRNIGRVKSGSLNIAANAVVKVGSTVVENIASTDLDTYYDKRYITIERNESAPGYVFTDDNTLTSLTDDYSSIRNGRVIDNAVRIAYQSYYEELKDDVDVDDQGRLSTAVEKALETKIEQEIDAEMRPQISRKSGTDNSGAVSCLVNPDPTIYASLYQQNNLDPSAINFNILTTNKVYVFIQLRPKGCLKFIDIFLGFTATN
jgi:hypothetical protein